MYRMLEGGDEETGGRGPGPGMGYPRIGYSVMRSVMTAGGELVE